MRCRLFLVFALVSLKLLAGPHVYTAEELSAKAHEQIHPAFTDNLPKNLRRTGFWLGCAAGIAAIGNGRAGKIFHAGVIGATLARWELDPERPQFLRHGSFADDALPVSVGIASFTRGRDIADPNQLVPDVVGLGVSLLEDGHFISWTATNSKAAFANTGERFARLGGFSAIGQMVAGGHWSSEELYDAHLRAQTDCLLGHESVARRPGPIRRSLMFGGRLIGESVYLANQICTGTTNLIPATLYGFRSPWRGHPTIGFGTDTRLLTENVAMQERRGFRLSFRLANTPTNQKLRERVPGFFSTLLNSALGTPVPGDQTGRRMFQWQHQTAQFYLGLEQLEPNEEIRYDVMVQLEDPANPERSPLNRADAPWSTEPHRVATLSLLRPESLRLEYRNTLIAFASRHHFSPAESHHLPLGDLAWTRSMGAVRGQQRQELLVRQLLSDSGPEIGAYETSRLLRGQTNQVEDFLRLVEFMKLNGMRGLPESTGFPEKHQ